MKKIHWFEAKQLDRVTNHSTRTECLKNILDSGVEMYYYCSFSRTKVYYGLKGNIKYLGILKNKYFKFLEFRFLVFLKALQIVLFSNSNILMVNQDLVRVILPAVFVNKILRKHNKFVLDIRTLPTSPDTFEKDMRIYNKQLFCAVRFFDGLSFITPFIEKISLQHYKKMIKTVNWSSGVNLDIFNAYKYDFRRDTDVFRIFYHGGISLSRGNLDLVKACERVVDRGYNIELVQIGKIVDKEIKNYIHTQKIDSWCKLYDSKPLAEMPVLVAKCDLPVLPFPNFLAWRVSSPLKLMEYLAIGKPVLVPDMECFTDILPAGSRMVHYYNANAQDPVEEMTKAIIQQITSTDLKQDFIREVECINYVSKNFTWKVQANNLLQFCVDLCQKTK